MNVLITFAFFIFANQMLHTFGKVILLRGSEPPEKPKKVKLICLSEDDGGALVWNYKLNKQYLPFIESDFSKSQLSRLK